MHAGSTHRQVDKGEMGTDGCWKRTVRTVAFSLAVAVSFTASLADERTPQKSPRKPVKLPGLVIDFEKRCVDLEASVCLTEGFLELIACRKGSKEHESIVSVRARPMHIHTALLLLGANNGNPAMRKPVDEARTRWVNVPPKGDGVAVYLVVPDSAGKSIERPVSKFIKHSSERSGDASGSSNGPAAASTQLDKKDAGKVFAEFLFAGSHLNDNKTGPRAYLADTSGNVISIVTFGDELLCLPGIQSRGNGALAWKVDSTHLPEVGTKITLRLRPQTKPTSGVKK